MAMDSASETGPEPVVVTLGVGRGLRLDSGDRGGGPGSDWPEVKLSRLG